MKLKSSVIKEKIAEWYQLLRPITEDDEDCFEDEEIKMYQMRHSAKGWKRGPKGKLGYFMDQGEFYKDAVVDEENVWFEGKDIGVDWYDDTELRQKVLQKFNNRDNTVRLFCVADGDSVDVSVISDPEDKEIILMFYHED